MALATGRLRNDLSSSAAEKIGIGKKKTAPVKLEVLGEARAKTKKATKQTSWGARKAPRRAKDPVLCSINGRRTYPERAGD